MPFQHDVEILYPFLAAHDPNARQCGQALDRDKDALIAMVSFHEDFMLG